MKTRVMAAAGTLGLVAALFPLATATAARSTVHQPVAVGSRTAAAAHATTTASVTGASGGRHGRSTRTACATVVKSASSRYITA